MQVINVRKGDPVDPIRCLQQGKWSSKYTDNEIVMKNIFDSSISSSSGAMPIYGVAAELKAVCWGVAGNMSNSSYNPSEGPLEVSAIH